MLYSTQYSTCYIVWYIACHSMVYSLLYSTTGFQSEAAPSPAASLLPATLHSVCSPLASVRNGSLPLQLSLGDSNPAWLTPAITPHPNVKLTKPAAVASSIPAVSHSSLAVSKAVGQGWSPAPCHKAWREWHPAQDAPSQAKVQAGEVRAAGSIVEHGHSVALRDRTVRTWSQRDGFESAEGKQYQLNRLYRRLYSLLHDLYSPLLRPAGPVILPVHNM